MTDSIFFEVVPLSLPPGLSVVLKLVKPMQDLRDMFSPFGSVQESRILHRGDDIRGAGALVRMNNVEAASRAIAALNGHMPRSHLGESLTNQPLLVRFADSPEEKARKQARKEQTAVRVHR